MADLIDRQATARRLLNERKHYDCYRDIGIGLDIARMIVEDYCPTVQPNTPTDTPTDLISRQAAIDNLLSINEVVPKNKLIDKNDAVKMLVRLPSAQPERCEDCRNFNKARLLIPQPERKKGKWILINGAAGVYECNQCHERVCCVGKYCMNCGLPMEVETE